jgi:sortase A
MMRKVAGALLVLAGLGLLGMAGRDVAGARLAQRALEVRLMQAAPSLPVELPTARLGGDPGGGSGAEALLSPGSPPPASATSPAPLAPELSYRQGEPLFRLAIPTIGVNNVVVYGSSTAALKTGPGLVERTALPGEVGNAVVAGHRDYYFWRLNDVRPGDPVVVSTPHGSLAYVVKEKRIVSEQDTSILDQTPYQQLTVFTCWPLIFAGRAPERLVITAVPAPVRPEEITSGE